MSTSFEHPWRDPPAWTIPAVIAITGLASVLVFWSLGTNHYANSYYADATLAASRSWRSFFLNSADLSNIVSVDKGPLSVWMMGLSGRLFGFGSLSMLVPNALCGIGAVLLLYRLALRAFGAQTALMAALMLAITPVSVLMSRFNNPDALLALLLTAAAWSLTRAVQSGRLRDTLLCGALVGLAFTTKMIVAYLVVPALAVTLLIAAPGPLRRRIGHLLAGGAVMVAVSMTWFAAVMLVPRSGRPFVGDTTDDSWFSLIFSANGLSRLTGAGRAGGRIAPSHPLNNVASGNFGGATGPLRLFDHQLAGEIAWLIPLAALGTLLGLWRWRHAPRTDLRRATVILLAGWAGIGCGVFSVQGGIFHPYYTSAVAAPIAALAGLAVTLTTDRINTQRRSAVLLGIALLITAAVAVIVLSGMPHFIPWLRWVVIVAAVLAVIGVMVLTSLRRSSTLSAAVLIAGAITILAGPLAFSWATAQRPEIGSNPTAGPAIALAPRVAIWHRELASIREATLNYLIAHRGQTTYLMAGEGVTNAAPYALHSGGAPVITMGGFQGYDPAPTVTALAALVRRGRLRYILVTGRDPRDDGDAGTTVDSHGGAQQARDRWVRHHCQVLELPGDGVLSPRLATAAGELFRCGTPISAQSRPRPYPTLGARPPAGQRPRPYEPNRLGGRPVSGSARNAGRPGARQNTRALRSAHVAGVGAP